MVDIQFEVYDAIFHAVLEFIIILLLLIPYIPHLKKFFWDMAGQFRTEERKTNRLITLGIPTTFVVLITVSVSAFIYNLKSSLSPIAGAYIIEKVIDNGNAILLKPGEFTKEPMLFFEVDNSSILSINDSTYYGKYNFDAGKITLSTNQGSNLFGKIIGTFAENKINGTTENEDHVEIAMKKIIE
jgi:hypothetical protein